MKTPEATFKLKPKAGVKVKDPLTREPLKNIGEEKPRSAYWLRRLHDEDVVQVKVNAKATANKETK